MTIGIPLGLPFGIIIDNITIGIPIGVAIGSAIGAAWEKKHENELRPLTKEEEDLKRKNLLFLLGFGVIGFIVFVVVYLLRNLFSTEIKKKYNRWFLGLSGKYVFIVHDSRLT